MHGVTHFEQGIDHRCDSVAMRWFKWRFPMLELRRFIACRDWPYTIAHHIVLMEGPSHLFLNLGILPRQLIPGPILRARSTRQFKVQRLTEKRVHVSMLIWQDAPLPDSHPLAPLCPLRWPVVDELDLPVRSGHLRLIRAAGDDLA